MRDRVLEGHNVGLFYFLGLKVRRDRRIFRLNVQHHRKAYDGFHQTLYGAKP